MNAARNYRNALIGKLHVAKGQLGMSDEEYRDMLQARYRVDSSKGLGVRQLDDCLRHLETLGFKPRTVRARKGDKGAPSEKAMSARAMLSKIEALLAEIGSRQGKHVPWDYAVAILYRMYKVDRLEWAKPDQLRGVIAALHKKAYGSTVEEIVERLAMVKEGNDPQSYAMILDWARRCYGVRKWAKVEQLLAGRDSTFVQSPSAELNK